MKLGCLGNYISSDAQRIPQERRGEIVLIFSNKDKRVPYFHCHENSQKKKKKSLILNCVKYLCMLENHHHQVLKGTD